MITKYIPSVYETLFLKANEALRTYKSIDDANIEDIDDYFKYIKTLAEIENTNSLDPIFTILPSDEDTFNINANSREINIPDSFKKYGVGVKGDEIAEIIYFSIDRYFDAVDLADKEILIQWQYEAKYNSDNDVFLSAAYKKSLTLQPGKIVFGWPITSEITAYAGNIKFSVRFYEKGLYNVNGVEKNILLYNFETLPATIKIQNSLSVELSDLTLEKAIDKNQMIYDRLRNSTVISNEMLAVPSFGTNQWVWNESAQMLQEHRDSQAYDTLIPFVAKASYAKDTNAGLTTHEIQYRWNNANNGTVESYYLEATEYNPYDIYYKIAADGLSYVPEKVGNKEAFDNSEIPLYVKATKFTPNIAGTYSVIASNVGEKKSQEVTSYVWVISGPEAPRFNTITSSARIDHENNSDAHVTINYELSGNVGEEVSNDVWTFTPTTGEPFILDNDATKNAYLINNDDIVECVTSIEGTVSRKITVEKNNATIDAESNAVQVLYEPGTPDAPEVTVTYNEDGTTNLVATIAPIEKGSGEITYRWGEWDNQTKKPRTKFTADNTYKIEDIKRGFFYCEAQNSYYGESVINIQNDISVNNPY